jgi:hypothetical protein
MKRIVFCSVFFGLLLTLVSFTTNKSNSLCPPSPPPVSINFFRINSECTTDYNVVITYPQNSTGEVYLDGITIPFAAGGIINSSYPQISFRVPCCNTYRVALGIWCDPNLVYHIFTSPSGYQSSGCSTQCFTCGSGE